MLYLVCCSKVWDPNICSKLSMKSGHDFRLITKAEELTLEYLEELKPEKIFFPHWSNIIKPQIFKAYECVIFHMTDLPYGRGGSPLQNLIIRNHEETMISALKCSEGVDTGPIYMKRPLSLAGSAKEIFVRATEVIEEMILRILEENPVPVPQQGEAVNFARRKPEESCLKPVQTIKEAYNLIRMLDAEGYPKAFLHINDLKYEFFEANLDSDTNVLEAKVRITKL